MQNGVEDALSTLFQRYYQSLYDYGVKFCQRPELVKDCIQEVFIYIWEKREKLSLPASVRAYLLSSYRRALLRKLQQKLKLEDIHNELGIINEVAFASNKPTDLNDTHFDKIQQVYREIEELPPRMREALYLKTFDNFSYREISEVMGISSQVARNYVCDALQRLRNGIINPQHD